MSEVRLIDANALTEEIVNIFHGISATAFIYFMHDKTPVEVYNRVRDLIDNAPTVERPQGEWIDDNNDSYYANCSCCGYQIDTHYERGYLNFCPNCGADMRGEKNEKT